MAGLTNADPRHHLAFDTPPPPIPKDMQGSDSSVPLSPQWLLPKPGDNKLGLAAAEIHPNVSKHTDPIKSMEYVEDLNVAEKKKDVFRPTFFTFEKGRQDQWGDEEREANPAVGRDLRREGEELGDSHKLERWSNNSSRYPGDARRFPSERWSDSVSRESAYEIRRESKWNPRWGPNDKESDNWREKGSGKDGETSHDKGGHHLTIHTKGINMQGKDTDKEGEHYSRSWRSSPSVNRGRGETSPYFTPTTNKPAPMFAYGRGKGDTGILSDGPTSHFPLGTASDRSNCSHRDPPVLKYSRIKLLDIYRRADLRGYRMPFEGFHEFPSLMQVDPLVPLTLTAPIPEELVIIEAMDKGDILSSGVPLASKDYSSGKNFVKSGLLPLTKSGIGDDVAPAVRDAKTDHWKKDHSCYVESAPGFDSNMPSSESLCQYQDVKLTAQAYKFEVPPIKAYDSSKREASKPESTIPWISQSDVRAESQIRRQPSETIGQGGGGGGGGEGFTHVHGLCDPFIRPDKLTDRKPQQYPSPELLVLLYKDPQGQIQGPFSGSNLIEWFDAGYFGIDLLVRLASAPADGPFSLLGDVIPQLRKRVRPPPGFGAARLSNIQRSSSSIHAGVSDEFMKKYQELGNESKVEAENRFLESLMSDRINHLSESYSIGELPHHIPQSPPPPINSALPPWLNFPEVQAMKNSHGFSSGVIPQEKPVASESSQDAQMVNLLRQQYMLNQQIHSQAPLTTQLNEMELFLLMQRQKQEQQQSQLLEQQKQHHLLSQALLGHHSNKHYDEQSFGPLLPQMHEIASNAVNNPVLSELSEGSLDRSAISETPGQKGVEDAVQCEVKRVSEKKSRKHKNSQLRATAEYGKGSGKGSAKAAPAQKSRPNSETGGAEKDIHVETAEPESLMDSFVGEEKVKEGSFALPLPNNQAWKAAPGQKAKPLLEIQVEEQRRVTTPQSSTVDTIPELMPSDSFINSEQIFSEEKGTSLPPLSETGAQIEPAVDDDDFIEAKETRKSRKKAAKNKSVAVKDSSPNNSFGLSVSSPSASEQTKAARQTQQDKDLLPPPPAVPSFGDFVFWKGDQATTAPTPAWSTDSATLQKPAFLRDIFKEQNKKTKSRQQQTPIPTPTKTQPVKGSSSSVSVFGSDSKVDDLFWEPLDQVKKGNSQRAKGTPVKGASGEGSSKKAASSSNKPAEHSITSSPAISRSLSKGKKESVSGYSEAMDFREWCEGEWLRLTGTNDTSFLEFCLKESTTEAEVLLRENLSSLDEKHEFIDKFMKYKVFLSPEIIEMAFRGRRRPQEIPVLRNVEPESKGKKKGGKKGKKLSPDLLGFNVVSNRIMMGEIQTIED